MARRTRRRYCTRGGSRVYDVRTTMVISKIYSPLHPKEVCAILDIDSIQYDRLVTNSELLKSLTHPDDPSHRISFHNFWDLIRFRFNQLIRPEWPDVSTFEADDFLSDVVSVEDDADLLGGDHSGHISCFGEIEEDRPRPHLLLSHMDSLYLKASKIHNQLCDTIRTVLNL